MMTFNGVKAAMRDAEIKGSAAAKTLVETEIRPQMEAMTKSKAGRFGLKALLAVAMMSSLATTAFATADLQSKIDTAKVEILAFFRNIIVAVGAVSLACCGIVLLFGLGGQRASESAKAWASRIFFGMAIVLSAEVISKWVSDLFGGAAPAGGGASNP